MSGSGPFRLWRSAAVAALTCAAVGASGCGAKYMRAEGPMVAAGPMPATSLTRHVLVISVDGLRPDAIQAFKPPTLERLLREGSYTLEATTILPSKTLPSHTSMLTGEPPERHHVLWNNVASAGADIIDLPNIFSVARSHGYDTAAFFSKAKFQPLQRPNTLDYTQAPGGWFGKWSAGRTTTDVVAYLGSATPNLLFVHLPDPDTAGHASGWMSPAYGRAVIAADTAIARLLQSADTTFGVGRYAVIVTADHGGHDRDHGSTDLRDVTIPWIAWGQGVKPGPIGAPIRTMDTASTALWLLGLDEPSAWVGAPVTTAFQSSVSVPGSGAR